MSASPEVKEYLIDSKKEVDRNLKINCEKFISETTQTYVVQIKRFLTQATAFTTANVSVITPGSKVPGSKNTNNANNNFPSKNDKLSEKTPSEPVKLGELSEQPFARAEKLHEIVNSCYKQIKQYTPKVFESLNLYLAQPEVEQILFKPVRFNVMQIFQQLDTILIEHYNEEDRAIVGVPGQEQISLILSK